jgi:hypothetical protein
MPCRRRRLRVTAISASILGAAACTEKTPSPSPPPFVDLGDAASSAPDDSDAAPNAEREGGALGADGGPIAADRFITKVVSFTPGSCAGFGATSMPDIVLGPPEGAGSLKGSLDVVSLGVGGEIVVSFEPNAIVDRAGPDFIVFENAFYAGGDPSAPSADLGEVSVSEDGSTWKTFPCNPGTSAPYGACAGWHPVYSAPGNGISPLDPKTAGGEAYDLSDLGITTARFVRIRDKSTASCPGGAHQDNAGFDLDAISVVNALDD